MLLFGVVIIDERGSRRAHGQPAPLHRRTHPLEALHRVFGSASHANAPTLADLSPRMDELFLSALKELAAPNPLARRTRSGRTIFVAYVSDHYESRLVGIAELLKAIRGKECQ